MTNTWQHRSLLLPSSAIMDGKKRKKEKKKKKKRKKGKKRKKKRLQVACSCLHVIQQMQLPE